MKKMIFPAALLLAGLAQGAHAAHPLATDDTGTQDKGNNQLEINTDWIKEHDEREHVGDLTYTFGLLPNLDIFVNAPVTLSSPAGINDVSLGAKWRLLEVGTASMALKPELLLPTGNPNKGLGNGRASMALTLIGSYELAPWSLHGNLQFTHNSYGLQTDDDANRSSLWRVSVAAMYAVTESIKLVAETGIQRNSDKSSDINPAFVLAGFIYSPNKSLDLDAGAKFGLGCNSCPDQVEHQIGVGLTWHF